MVKKKQNKLDISKHYNLKKQNQLTAKSKATKKHTHTLTQKQTKIVVEIETY